MIVDGSDNLISKDSHWIIHEPGIEIIYKQCDICMSTLVLQLKSIFMKNPTFDRLVFFFCYDSKWQSTRQCALFILVF